MDESENEATRESENDLLTVAEAATALGLTDRGVQYRLKHGLLRGRLVAGRVWLIPRAEVEAARTTGRLSPGPRPGTRRRAGDQEG